METGSHLLPQTGKTLFLAAILAVTGSFIAFLTEWMIVIPLLFSLAIPMMKIRTPISNKLLTTLWIVLGTIVIFTGAVILMLNISYTRQELQGAVVGIAGCLILLLNGMLIPSLNLTLRSFVITFLLSAFSIPIGMLLTKNLPASSDSLMVDFFSQFRIMILWMVFTAAGILYGAKRKITTSEY